jgi:hypothetical protein
MKHIRKLPRESFISLVSDWLALTSEIPLSAERGYWRTLARRWRVREGERDASGEKGGRANETKHVAHWAQRAAPLWLA